MMIQLSILMIIVVFFLLTIIEAAAADSSIAAAASVLTTKTNKHERKHKHKHEHDDGSNNGLGAALLKLNDGNYIPQIGMGVELTGSNTYNAVIYALQHVGYRLFDTASEESYNNEDQVGNAIYDYNYNTNRSGSNNNCDDDDDDDPNSGDASSSSDNNNSNNNNIFVTTKLWDTDHGFYNTIKAFMISYRELNLQNIKNKQKQKQFKPIDLYLMHSPYGGRILETYDAMLYIQAQQQSQGKNPLLRSIGVSNFDIRHLEVIRINNRPMPTINQIEMHPLVYKQRKKLIDYCHQHQIQIQAFGSLMHAYSHFIGDSDGDGDHTNGPQFLSDMVQRYNTNGIQYNAYNGNRNGNGNETTSQQQQQQITTAHILLQWAIQHKFAIIPKSSRNDRIQNNVRYINLGQPGSDANAIDFLLSDNDMKLLDEWGDSVPYQYQNIYKRDWNWNPIDEAPVHIGRTAYYYHYNAMATTSANNNNSNNDDVVFDVDEDKIGIDWNTIYSNNFDFDLLDYDDEDYDDDGYFNSSHSHEDDDDDDDDEGEEEEEEEEIRTLSNEL